MVIYWRSGSGGFAVAFFVRRAWSFRASNCAGKPVTGVSRQEFRNVLQQRGPKCASYRGALRECDAKTVLPECDSKSARGIVLSTGHPWMSDNEVENLRCVD